jgi:hypothetical protein
MDRVRVWEAPQGITTVQAELFPDISIGDAPAATPGPAPAASVSGAPATSIQAQTGEKPS